jgi:hypothetical protein
MLVLKGTHPIDGEVEQLFTDNERETAIAIGRAWQSEGLRPRLLSKSWNGQFRWLTSHLGQMKAAA